MLEFMQVVLDQPQAWRIVIYGIGLAVLAVVVMTFLAWFEALVGGR